MIERRWRNCKGLHSPISVSLAFEVDLVERVIRPDANLLLHRKSLDQ